MSIKFTFYKVMWSIPNFSKAGFSVDGSDFEERAQAEGFTDRFTDTKSPVGCFFVNNADECFVAVPFGTNPETIY